MRELLWIIRTTPHIAGYDHCEVIYARYIGMEWDK